MESSSLQVQVVKKEVALAPGEEAKAKANEPKEMKKELMEEKKAVKVEFVELQRVVAQVAEASSSPPTRCRCLIDLSSPAALERDFYAWLNGVQPTASAAPRPCLFNGAHSPPPYMAMLPPNDRLSMLSLAECHVSGGGHYAELPAFLAPSDCSSSASSLSSSASASSASSSSISPGGTAHCCSFASSTDNSSLSSCSFPLAIHAQQQQQFQQRQPTVKVAVEAEGKSPPINGNGGMRMRRKRNVDKASGRGTNLYGRSYCPGRPLSMEERAQIIHLFHGGMKVNAISKQLCISHGCVSKIITRFRETGNLMPSSHSECRRRKRLQQQMQMQQQGHQLVLGIGMDQPRIGEGRGGLDQMKNQ